MGGPDPQKTDEVVNGLNEHEQIVLKKEEDHELKSANTVDEVVQENKAEENLENAEKEQHTFNISEQVYSSDKPVYTDKIVTHKDENPVERKKSDLGMVSTLNEHQQIVLEKEDRELKAENQEEVVQEENNVLKENLEENSEDTTQKREEQLIKSELNISGQQAKKSKDPVDTGGPDPQKTDEVVNGLNEHEQIVLKKEEDHELKSANTVDEVVQENKAEENLENAEKEQHTINISEQVYSSDKPVYTDKIVTHKDENPFERKKSDLGMVSTLNEHQQIVLKKENHELKAENQEEVVQEENNVLKENLEENSEDTT